METEFFLYRLLIGMLGVFSLLVIIWAARNMGKGPAATAAWTRGGAVAVAVAGMFGLLLALAKI